MKLPSHKATSTASVSNNRKLGFPTLCSKAQKRTFFLPVRELRASLSTKTQKNQDIRASLPLILPIKTLRVLPSPKTLKKSQVIAPSLSFSQQQLANATNESQARKVGRLQPFTQKSQEEPFSFPKVGKRLRTWLESWKTQPREEVRRRVRRRRLVHHFNYYKY